jgi:hypothetical protein
MSRTLATLSLIATVVFVLAILALHILRPDVNRAALGISFYALGKLGWLLGLALSLVGVSGIALAVARWPEACSTLTRVALVLLVIWGISSVLAGLFPLDAPGAAPTISGRIHNLSGLNFLLVVPSVLMLELGFSDGRAPRRLHRATYWLAWLLLASAVLLFVLNGPLYSLQVGGAAQRLYWLVLVLWLFLKASHTRSTAGTVMP